MSPFCQRFIRFSLMASLVIFVRRVISDTPTCFFFALSFQSARAGRLAVMAFFPNFYTPSIIKWVSYLGLLQINRLSIVINQYPPLPSFSTVRLGNVVWGEKERKKQKKDMKKERGLISASFQTPVEIIIVACSRQVQWKALAKHVPLLRVDLAWEV